MWICTPWGFMSVTHRPGGKRNELQVRARDRKALLALRRRYMPGLGRIYETPARDYRFRAYVDRDTFASAVATMVRDISYDNFKDAAKTADLHQLYAEVWWTIHNHYHPLPLWTRDMVWDEVDEPPRRKAG